MLLMIGAIIINMCWGCWRTKWLRLEYRSKFNTLVYCISDGDMMEPEWKYCWYSFIGPHGAKFLQMMCILNIYWFHVLLDWSLRLYYKAFVYLWIRWFCHFILVTINYRQCKQSYAKIQIRNETVGFKYHQYIHIFCYGTFSLNISDV